MFKVSYSTSTINSFGRINFADSLIGNAAVADSQFLGKRDVTVDKKRIKFLEIDLKTEIFQANFFTCGF